MNENNQQPTVADLIETLHAMREVFSKYEKKYNMLTEQFFELYSQGLLDDDGPNFEFADWAGSYKTALQCQRLYNDYFKGSTAEEKLARMKSHVLVA
jgi:hypothetical protein